MYIPPINAATDNEEIVAFMKQFSFATIVTAQNNFPIATHLPFLVNTRADKVVLTSHFAKANNHWSQIENTDILVIFTEPHAYISPQHYDHERNVPTWNYISVHAYGKGRLVTELKETFDVLESTIDHFEAAYRPQWNALPDTYKLKMAAGIVAFEIEVTDLQAKKKLSQNRSDTEKQKIIESLSKSTNTNEQLIAAFMKHS